MKKIDVEKKPNILVSAAKKGMQNMIIIAALAVLVLIFWALNPNFLNKFNIVGVTAGASTPSWIIEDVINFIESL